MCLSNVRGEIGKREAKEAKGHEKTEDEDKDRRDASESERSWFWGSSECWTLVFPSRFSSFSISSLLLLDSQKHVGVFTEGWMRQRRRRRRWRNKARSILASPTAGPGRTLRPESHLLHHRPFNTHYPFEITLRIFAKLF